MLSPGYVDEEFRRVVQPKTCERHTVPAASDLASRPPLHGVFDLLGVALEAGQRAYARVAFDGVDPCDLEADERESARALFGPVDRISPLLATSLPSSRVGARAKRTSRRYVPCTLR